MPRFSRRGLRFSLRTALALLSVACVLLATLGRHAQRILERRRAVEAIVAAGGTCTLESGASRGRPVSTDTAWSRGSPGIWELALGYRPTHLLVRGASAAQTRALLGGLASLSDVKSLTIDARGLGDDDCLVLAGLPRLESLEIVRPGQLTARGLAQALRPTLRALTLLEADFTDDDLERLPLPETLEFLDLWGCGRLTDRAVARIVERCPKLRSLSLTSRQVTDQSVAALGELADLERLNVYQTAISPRGLRDLRRTFGGRCQVYSDVAEAAADVVH